MSVNVQYLRYLGDCSKFAPEIKFPTGSPVVHLLFIRSPFTVLLTISEIVVHSLQSKSIWFFSHICEKIFKIKPSIANFDITVLIISNIAFSFGFGTSLNHCSPGGISLGSTHSVFPNNWRFRSATSAIRSFFMNQILRVYKRLFATNTKTENFKLIKMFWVSSYGSLCKPKTKLFSNRRFILSHGTLTNISERLCI